MTIAATSSTAGTLFRDVAPWLVVIVVLVVAGVVVIAMLRRLTRDLDGGAAGTAFTLQELRDMRDAGQLTADEFDRARAEIIGRFRRPESTPDDQRRAAPDETGSSADR